MSEEYKPRLSEYCQNDGCENLHKYASSFIFEGVRYNFCSQRCTLSKLKKLRCDNKGD